MPYESIEMSTVEEAREYAASQGGRYLVLDSDTLRQIDEAEAAGGYQGGMSGSSDGAPYTASGNAGDVASDAATPPAEDLYLEGWQAITIEDAVEKVMDLKDVVETWLGEMTGPVLLVPTKELNRWLGRPDPDDGA